MARSSAAAAAASAPAPVAAARLLVGFSSALFLCCSSSHVRGAPLNAEAPAVSVALHSLPPGAAPAESAAVVATAPGDSLLSRRESDHCAQCGNPNAKFCCKFHHKCCEIVCGEDMRPCWPPVARSCSQGRCGSPGPSDALPALVHVTAPAS